MYILGEGVFCGSLSARFGSDTTQLLCLSPGSRRFDAKIRWFHHIAGAKVLCRVGAGAERMEGGDACVALGGVVIQPPLCGGTKFFQPLAREAYTCYSYSRTTVIYIYSVQVDHKHPRRKARTHGYFSSKYESHPGRIVDALAGRTGSRTY